MTKRFTNLLVANRGEIALRIMRTARSLGLRTIAVYSDADGDALHVRMADEAVLLGPAPVAESYLSVDRILDAARRAGAEAVHPGYGFLSENASFARACEGAGLVFIGPDPDAIEVMGNKAEAKRRMIAAGVPCVPGYQGDDASNEAFVTAARGIGYPVMVKAAAGGGGRGMRLVHSPSELEKAIALARSEAENAFGSGELILEKALVRPRHVEIQVFADRHGNFIHLGERDCSVQRRHQKVIEEAPCPIMTSELREAMGGAAVEAARAIDYVGAGTVEFLLDQEGAFYFLEMNTRLQVEHPVTELVTGVDLVELQIAVARGEALEIRQEDVVLDGHAIEVRLYAEDPSEGFLPSTGTIDLWRPAEGDGLRFDAGITTGQVVSPFYDPLLAKVISWGPTREIARRRLIDGLDRTALFGVQSNRDFLIHALGRDTFADGHATTAFLEEEFSEEGLDAPALPREQLAAAAVLEVREEAASARAQARSLSAPLENWTSSASLTSRVRYRGDEDMELVVSPQSEHSYRVLHADDEIRIEVLDDDGVTALMKVGEHRMRVLRHAPAPGTLHVSIAGRTHTFENENAAIRTDDSQTAGGDVNAPMHGKLIEVFVTAGTKVRPGDRLAVLEAMKMQHEIHAAVEGTVAEVPREAGTQVAAGELLVRISLDEPAQEESR